MSNTKPDRPETAQRDISAQLAEWRKDIDMTRRVLTTIGSATAVATAVGACLLLGPTPQAQAADCPPQHRPLRHQQHLHLRHEWRQHRIRDFHWWRTRPGLRSLWWQDDLQV